ncbi:hypothetical protein ZEAMMB73_Zm00001d020891 [Zea mays]|uniref:Uncharacterized protein n=1 Tax=Zea mays TaxID=4577 RepID=A0A1D6I6S1_MAIZE|nr:hypothetical protein ZEAMMB73_Zm00001d020891 [Zea mays]
MELYLTRQTVVEPYTVPFQMPPFPKHIFLSLADIAELPNRTLVDIMAIVVHLDVIHRTMWGPFRKIVVMDARWSLHAIKVWGDLLNKNALRWVLAKENCSIIIGTMFRRFRRQGKRVFLPRIPFKRTQFPLRLSFAMTVNKAQGQTIPHVGVYLPNPVFSHGQLYVALSRATTRSNVKILAAGEMVLSKNSNETYTKNIVYKEVLTS